MFSFPPIVSRFLRSKAWWDVIKYNPGDLIRYLAIKNPAAGIVVGVWGYYYFWRNPLKQAEIDRFSRFRDEWRAEVHFQESTDWETKKVKNI